MRRISAAEHAAAVRYLGQLADDHATVKAADSTEPYKLARRTRLNETTWNPQDVSGDSATSQSIQLSNARVREEARNNPHFVKTTGVFTDLVVGCGVQAYSDPFSIGMDLDDERLDFELNYAVESDEWFERWANDPKQCDAAGKQSWWDMQRSSFGELPDVGDALLLRCSKRAPGRLVPLCYQQIEREQLDRSKDREAGPAQNKIVNGIELDKYNSPVAYWIFDSHPDDAYSGGMSDSKPIPASRVIHAFIPFRPSMNAGFSWYRAMAQLTRDRNWMMGNYLTKVAVDALMTLVHFSEDGGTVNLEGEDATGTDGRPEVRMTSGGQVTHLSNKDKIEMFQSGNNPPQSLPAFVDVIDHDAAAAMQLSHLRYTGRWSKLSYTAGRGAQLDDEMHCKPLRRFWGNAVVMPVRQGVNEMMVAMGHVRSITSRDLQANHWELNNFMVVGPGREMLDPEGESDSAKSKLGSGLSTLQLELGKLGLHWVKVLRQIRLENKIMQKFGIVLDFSKGGGQQAGTRLAGESASEAKARTSKEARARAIVAEVLAS